MTRYIRHGTFGDRGCRVGLVQPKSGVFFADYYEKATGRRITRSLQTTDLNAAKIQIGDIIEQQKAGRPTRATGGDTVLYVLQRGDDGPIKVGRSRNPKQRARDLQTGNAEKLKIIRVYTMHDVEMAVHAELERKSRLEGEWFPADLLELVDRFFVVDSGITTKRARKRQGAITTKYEHLMRAGLL